MKHANNFDFLRFLFAFLVVLGHTIILSKQPEFQNEFLAAMPNYSVYCFFIISGFLIFSSFEKLNNLKKYIINRSRRIFPAYFFVVLFFSFFLLFFSNVKNYEYFTLEWTKYVGANLLFANFLQPCINYVFTSNLICAVNGSLWTIKVELMFYAFIPALFYCLKNRSIIIKNMALIVIYGLSIFYFWFVVNLGKYELARQLPGVLCYFVSGIFLFVNLEFFKKWRNTLLPFAIAAIFLEKGIFHQNLLTPIALGICIFWFAFSNIPLKNFAKYGDYSYGIYLVHFPIVQLFVQENLFEKYSFYAFFACLSIVLLFSIFIWNFIEKPVLKRKFNHKSAV
ncbi:acyltransferase family protein [Chryseobacterium sp. MP_3.2]|uniref:acyltransferase family protein n=1 Tax=Chryseobacterium sp. MP_3.2 TaxID=3071712 RepID=UPI002DF9956B|nr:peptidoglycan/LPS O-acetylase OafA/YrhL [Chryseobacterium sp. MP_3.2]